MLTLSDEHSWQSFFQSDILQVISVSLFFLVTLAAVLRRESKLYPVAALVSLAVVLLAPLVREMDHSALPIWVQPYLTMRVKSQFPLFPWSAFLISGAIVGYLFIRSREEKRERTFMSRLGFLVIGGIFLSLLMELLPLTVYPNHDFWQASPEFFFVRFGIIILITVGLWRIETAQNDLEKDPSTFPKVRKSFLLLFGQESLLVYYVHLLLVYGDSFKWSFSRQFGPNLNYRECLGLFVVLLLAMYLLAFGWHTLKLKNKKVSEVVQYAVLAGIVLQFILR